MEKQIHLNRPDSTRGAPSAPSATNVARTNTHILGLRRRLSPGIFNYEYPKKRQLFTLFRATGDVALANFPSLEGLSVRLKDKRGGERRWIDVTWKRWRL